MMESPEKQLHDLLDSILDGNWTPRRKGDLAAILKRRPELQADLIEQLRVHSQLQWHAKDLDDELRFEAELVEFQREVKLSESFNHPGHPSYLRWFAAAMVLCCVVTLGMLGLGERKAKTLAEVIDQKGVVWAAGSTALGDGDLAQVGSLENSAGEYKLRFSSGPIVEVAGPTSLEIVSGQLVRLTRGQATADVPERAKGFTIATPVVDVVDQGTRFGVSVGEQDATEVIVFEGKVDLERMSGQQSKPQQLLVGEGVQVGAQGIVGRLMQVALNAQGSWRPSGHPEFDGKVIKRVRDNIPPSDGSLFYAYQVSYGGLKEEATAYGENVHQWNGLTAEGLPEFLLGADYVMTFNDYRYMEDFSMTIELERPANLYIFADDRIPAPEWLRRQFEDTGIDIGLDEGHWNHVPEEYEHLNVNTTDTGGGKSIDNVFSAWRRRCTDTTPIVLGNAGELKTEGFSGRAMYGIAATPLEQPLGPARLPDSHLLSAAKPRHGGLLNAHSAR